MGTRRPPTTLGPTTDVPDRFRHSVAITVRSNEKAESVENAFHDLGRDGLDFAIVPDVAQPHAFDAALVSDPPIEAVIHTQSPFHFNVTEIKKGLLEPAIIGTTCILKAVLEHAPLVKRVVRIIRTLHPIYTHTQ